MVEDILRKHQEVGQYEDCIGVIDGVSLLLAALQISFTDQRSIFRASFQPHGQLGRQAAGHEGVMGLQGEAVPVQGAVGSMMRVTVGWDKGMTGCRWCE